MPGSLRKILLTTPYDLAVHGGVNNQLWGLYRALKRMHGYEVKVIGPSSDPDSHKCPDLVVAGKVVSWLLNRAMSNVTPDIRILPTVKALLREFKPDIVHLQEPLLPVLNTFVLYYSRAVNVGTYHTYSETSRGYDYAKPILKWHHNRVHIKIGVSSAACRFVGKTFPGTYHIIPNAVDIPEIQRNESLRYRSEKREKTILYVGRINEPRKGFTYMLEALDILDSISPGRYRLLAVGSGRESLKNIQFNGQIEWLGKVSQETLDAAYASCDILCAPSLGGESFGIILLEAFSHGKPVVAFNITGYREFAGSTGAVLLTPTGDSRRLAEGIVTVLRDKKKYREMSTAALSLAREHAWPKVIKRITTLYDYALKKKKAALSQNSSAITVSGS